MGLGFVRPFSTVILFPKRGLTSNSKSPPLNLLYDMLVRISTKIL